MEQGVFHCLMWNVMSHFVQVAFSDEKKFQIFGDQPVRVWRRDGQRLQANFTRKVTQNKKGVMCWLGLKPNGASLLLRVPGTLDSIGYQTNVLTPALGFIRGTIFQQDNATPHVSRSTVAWLARRRVRLLPEWPPCSPDLNIVENAWAHLARQLVGQSFSSEDALWHAISSAWAQVPPAFVRKLYDSIPRRLEAVGRARGAATRY